MASPSINDICKCGHLRGEHFRRVCTMSVDECAEPCECSRFRLDAQACAAPGSTNDAATEQN